MTMFWQRWLTVWCLCTGLFGLILYGAGFPTTASAAAAVFAAFGDPLPAAPDRYLRFSISLMGAVTAGWAATLYAAFRAAWVLNAAAAAPIWRMLTVVILAWYVIDSAASIVNGFGVNAASNTLLLVGFLIPIVAARARSAPTDKPF